MSQPPSYPETLLRLIFPHVYLNEGRGLLDWKWIKINASPERAAWLYEYRVEAGLIWVLELLGMMWIVVKTHADWPMLSAFAETFSMLWLLYGLVLNRALRWSAPNLRPPLTLAEKREFKRQKRQWRRHSSVRDTHQDHDNGKGD